MIRKKRKRPGRRLGFNESVHLSTEDPEHRHPLLEQWGNTSSEIRYESTPQKHIDYSSGGKGDIVDKYDNWESQMGREGYDQKGGYGYSFEAPIVASGKCPYRNDWEPETEEVNLDYEYAAAFPTPAMKQRSISGTYHRRGSISGKVNKSWVEADEMDIARNHHEAFRQVLGGEHASRQTSRQHERIDLGERERSPDFGDRYSYARSLDLRDQRWREPRPEFGFVDEPNHAQAPFKDGPRWEPGSNHLMTDNRNLGLITTSAQDHLRCDSNMQRLEIQNTHGASKGLQEPLPIRRI
jgi:hypothetical protein